MHTLGAGGSGTVSPGCSVAVGWNGLGVEEEGLELPLELDLVLS